MVSEERVQQSPVWLPAGFYTSASAQLNCGGIQSRIICRFWTRKHSMFIKKKTPPVSPSHDVHSLLFSRNAISGRIRGSDRQKVSVLLNIFRVSEDRAMERTNASRQHAGNWPCPGKLSQNQQLTQNRRNLWINGLQCVNAAEQAVFKGRQGTQQ